MLEFYEENKDEKFKREPRTRFLLIDIRKEGQPQKAMERAQKALEEIKSGREFADCVADYSQGIKAKSGGLWETSEPSSLISPYDQVVKTFEAMEEGQFSGIIETDENLFIVKLLENTTGGYIPFVSVQEDIEKYLKASQRREDMNELLSDLFEQADITGLEGFLQYCVGQIYVRGKNM
jgi:parvulin-like peptidyl-prolyl isomerase